jgi:hypothetical protein
MVEVRNDMQKPFKKDDDKRAAIELWMAQVPLSRIRAQLKMSERTLGRILAIAIKMVWLDKTEPCDFLQKLVASMLKRMQVVINRGGGGDD